MQGMEDPSQIPNPAVLTESSSKDGGLKRFTRMNEMAALVAANGSVLTQALPGRRVAGCLLILAGCGSHKV